MMTVMMMIEIPDCDNKQKLVYVDEDIVLRLQQ